MLHPERCAALFKRHMGSDWKTTLAGRTFTPEELSSLVLRTLKEDAEAHLQGAGGPRRDHGAGLLQRPATQGDHATPAASPA